jgi:alpha-beta hydrolase superfamily lysophospholipase
MASLVQDVWLGWEPRLRARRLAPWEEPAVRLLFHLDAGTTLDDPVLVAFLESLGTRLEVVAWEARGQGGSAGRLGPEVIDDARRLVVDSSRRWGGGLPLVLGGHGLGAWTALAVADTPGVAGVLALAPSLSAAGPEPSPLRAAILGALARPPLDLPTLVVEGRDRARPEAEAVAEWMAREPRASRLVADGGDAAVLAPPWRQVVAAWAEAVGKAARG